MIMVTVTMMVIITVIRVIMTVINGVDFVVTMVPNNDMVLIMSRCVHMVSKVAAPS